MFLREILPLGSGSRAPSLLAAAVLHVWAAVSLTRLDLDARRSSTARPRAGLDVSVAHDALDRLLPARVHRLPPPRLDDRHGEPVAIRHDEIDAANVYGNVVRSFRSWVSAFYLVAMVMLGCTSSTGR